MTTTRRLLLVLAVLTGALVGAGAGTLYEARAFSYLSSDPKVCVNCHIMQPQYDSWLRASHHAVAGCGDCHLPHDFLGKWFVKALNGYHHSKAFTFQDFHEPIIIKPRNARVLQANCLRCHGDLVHDLLATRDAARSGDELRCVHCHASAGHGETVGLGGPDRDARRMAAPPPPP
ncbi:MAG: cytochrome c nitrite reductase small subunit [Proteobacteria bacterium]|nr:cytochrome c nitrite reductase small subunit [Pseudomonadota bacterium]